MKAVLLDQATFHPSLNWDKVCYEVDELRCYQETNPDELYNHVADADIIITNKVKLFENELKQLPQAKLICIAATGMNNVDIKAARTLGISVRNVINYSTHAVAEHVMSFILNFSTQHINRIKDVQRGAWNKASVFCLQTHRSFSLQDKVLGIVGYGAIGRAVEKLAQAFGMRVLIADSFHGTIQQKQRVSLDNCLQQSDFVTLHCPLTTQTNQFMNAKRLACMSPHAYLINTARGGLVDEVALADALLNGRLAGAGLDVLSQEPPKSDNPLLIMSHPQLLITPHVAWACIESQETLVEQLAKNISSWQLTIKTISE